MTSSPCVPERLLPARMDGLRTFDLPLPVPGFSVILDLAQTIAERPGQSLAAGAARRHREACASYRLSRYLPRRIDDWEARGGTPIVTANAVTSNRSRAP